MSRESVWHKLLPNSIENVFKGKRIFSKDELRRIGNSLSGGVGGLVGGGYFGAGAGGVLGYQDKRANTGRRLLQSAGKGLAAGLTGRGLKYFGGKIGSKIGSNVAAKFSKEEIGKTIAKKAGSQAVSQMMKSGPRVDLAEEERYKKFILDMLRERMLKNKYRRNNAKIL